jgi:ribonuclease T2
MLRSVRCTAAMAAILLGLFILPGHAQDRRQSAPGQFDFYVLALSWSPSYCDAARERNPDRPPEQQCGERPYAFVVHGLWPQYDKGSPEFCQQPAPRLSRPLVSAMLDLMPSPRLVFHEWDKHGTCSGLSPGGYFETVRKARALVKIPAEFIELAGARLVTPGEVEEAFIQANPGLPAEAIAVSCDSKRLSEVRICVGKDLRFRACPDVDRRACRRDRLVMPPVRGSS